MPETQSPDAFDRLRAARPEIDDALLSPHSPAAQALMEEIVSMESNEPTANESSTTAPAARRPRPARAWMAAGAAAAAIAVIVAAVTTSGGNGSPSAAPRASVSSPAPTSAPVAQLVNIRTIAARSNRALGTSGRARITFAGDASREGGTTDLAFAGRNVEMTIHFASLAGRPGFDTTNKTVDGEFYLYTEGPDGVERWYHDTNAGGSSVFDTDPRTLLATLAPEAAFVKVGTGTIDGVAVTHLRATKLGALPSLNLSLGPIDAREMHALDLWVGADDVVRRLDLTTEQHERTLDPKTAPKLQKNTDGTITIIGRNGETKVVKGEDLTDVLKGYPSVTTVHRSNYSVSFSDIGGPITVAAPADAVDVAGQG